MPTAKLKTAVPVIASNDVAGSVDYFVRVLGFERQWVWGEPPVYAGVRSGDAILYISHDAAYVDAIRNLRLAPDIYIWVDDVETLYAQHLSTGAEIIEKVETKPWGTRQYTIREPNGYRLKFASDVS